MRTYWATVTATYMQGDITFNTLVGANSIEQAKSKLEREGYVVSDIWAA
jgi:hypothetical protein